SLREPERWVEAKGQKGTVADLFSPQLRRRTLVGVGLTTVGLATFWGVHIYGKDFARKAWGEANFAPTGWGGQDQWKQVLELKEYAGDLKAAEMRGMFLTTLGGGLGLVCFGPLSERLGRRLTFVLFQLGGLAAIVLLVEVLRAQWAVLAFLPIF